MSKRSKYTDIELPELSFSPCWQTQSMVVVIWLARRFFSSAMCTIPLCTAKDLHCDAKDRTLAHRRAVPTFSFQPRYSSGIAAPLSTSMRSGLPRSIAIIVTEVHLRRVTPTTESLQRKGEEAGVPGCLSFADN